MITNKENGKQYVGQTSRDIDVRFEEHMWGHGGASYLHNAIQKYGRQNFTIKELEQVPISELDEKEKYWIKKLDTQNTGYNLTIGGTNIAFGNTLYNNILIVEKDFYIDSVEYLGRKISSLTLWSTSFVCERIRRAIKENQEYLGYHFKYCKAPQEAMVDEDVLEDWIKTLSIKFSGKHVFSRELNMEFDTIGEASNYCLKNGYYLGTSRYPEQDIRTLISNAIKKEELTPIPLLSNLTFEQVYGVSSKKTGGDFEKKKVYCPQLDMTFESQNSAAQYFVEKNLFGRVKLKTAKLRISDIVRGYFPDYKGYSFAFVEETEEEKTLKEKQKEKRAIKTNKTLATSSAYYNLINNKEEVIRRYENGESMEQLAKAFSSYRAYVHKFLKANKVQTRTCTAHQLTPVLRINEQNEVENIYPSIKSTVDDGFCHKSVSRALSNKKLYKKYRWEYLSNYPNIKIGDKIK